MIVLLNHNLKIILILILMPVPIALYADQFRVTRVYDGETITAVENGKEIEIRLVGIDAPELSKMKHLPGQPFSMKAKEHLASFVLNNAVTIKSYGNDRYPPQNSPDTCRFVHYHSPSIVGIRPTTSFNHFTSKKFSGRRSPHRL